MRLLLVAVTIALLGGCLNALPAGDGDFTIDMYSNVGHLRFERSTEAKAGTVVTVEKAAVAPEKKDTAAAKTIETKEPLKIEDALNLVKKTVQKLESESSAAAPPQISKVETAAPAQQTKSEATSAAKPAAEQQGVSISSSASIISAPHEPAVGSVDTNDEATFSAYSQKYVNPYGDVLNRINKDKVQQLASNRRSLFDRFDRFVDRAPSRSSSNYERKEQNGAKLLSSPIASSALPSNKHGMSNSISRVMINGRDVSDKKLTPQSRYSYNPYGESASLLRQKNVRPSGQWNGVKVLSFQPQGMPIRYL